MCLVWTGLTLLRQDPTLTVQRCLDDWFGSRTGRGGRLPLPSPADVGNRIPALDDSWQLPATCVRVPAGIDFRFCMLCNGDCHYRSHDRAVLSCPVEGTGHWGCRCKCLTSEVTQFHGVPVFVCVRLVVLPNSEDARGPWLGAPFCVGFTDVPNISAFLHCFCCSYTAGGHAGSFFDRPLVFTGFEYI